jgi:hypothetical protein
MATALAIPKIEKSIYRHRLVRVRDIVASDYAISLDRKLKHPAVIAILEFAHRSVFPE